MPVVQAGRRSAGGAGGGEPREEDQRRAEDDASQQAACLLVSARVSPPIDSQPRNTPQEHQAQRTCHLGIAIARGPIDGRPVGLPFGVVYDVLKLVLCPLLRCSSVSGSSGAENIPETGGVIIASNHQAFCDSLFIPLVVPRRVTFVAKADYFKSWKTRGSSVPSARSRWSGSGGKASKRSLDMRRSGCSNAAERSASTRRARGPPDDRLHRGRTGVARLIVAAHARSSRSASRGTREVQPIGANDAAPFKTVEIRFGRPIDFCARYGIASTTRSCCARSPTSSCSRSASCPARPTSTGTPPGGHEATRRAGRRPTAGGRCPAA